MKGFGKQGIAIADTRENGETRGGEGKHRERREQHADDKHAHNARHANFKQDNQGVQQRVDEAASAGLLLLRRTGGVGGGGVADNLVVDALRVHRLAAHLQFLFGRLRRRHEEPQHEIDNGHRGETEEAEQHHGDAPRQRVGAAEVVAKPGKHAAQHLVVLVAVEPAAAQPICQAVGGACRCARFRISFF